MIWKQGARRAASGAALAFGGVLAAGILPFLVADPVAFYEDTISYGAGTYRIVGYGLSAILVRLGIVDDRDGRLPVRAARAAHLGAADRLAAARCSAARRSSGSARPAFAVSILWLMFIGRTFNNYYLVWPMTGAVVAALMALGSRVRPIDLGPGEAILHEGDPGRCAVLLPGVRYFSQAPLLWFAREAAQAAGWSVLELSERAPAGEEPVRVDARAGRARARRGRGRDTVAVIGKSLGSAAAPLVAERGLPAVWLTPLLSRPEVVAALRGGDAPALARGQPRRPDVGRRRSGPASGRLEVLEFDGPGPLAAGRRAIRSRRSTCCGR